MAANPLPPGQLFRRCLPEGLPFSTTAELPDLDGPVCQERALEALEFGVALRAPGHHVYALGPPGVGKHSIAALVVGRRAASESAAADWCYLNNFTDPQKPRALRLPPGESTRLRRDLERLVEDLQAAIPAAFEAEDFRARLQALEKELESARNSAMQKVQELAAGRGVALIRTPVGFGVAPLRGGEVLPPDDFGQLPEQERERMRQAMSGVQEELQAALRSMPRLEREHRERVKQLNRQVALDAIGHLVDELRRGWANLPNVLAHIEAVQADVLENVHDFLGSSDEEDAAGQVRKLLTQSPALRRYVVNVMVDQGATKGSPVVDEDVPSYANLAGRIEHHAHFGSLVTDFTMVRPGALHRANGGYLLLDARRLVSQPFAWEGLKRALQTRQIRMETPERLVGLSATASLEPEPIPLDVKVVLLGDRLLYHLLSRYDPEFPELFRVAADFDDTLPRDGHEQEFARLVATLARRDGLRPLSREAVARVIENASRLAGDSGKLSAEIRSTADLLREADHRARTAGREVVSGVDVEAAVEARWRRYGRVRELVLEEIARGTLLVDTAGEEVGQVNGLSVLQVGEVACGRPTRITARVRLGKGEVVDIEREVELGGPIHSKGVLILASFLAARFAPERPFSLSASLVFEQSYSGVEGDSASCAELYALVSALAGVPLRQGMAVTGSVNQLGQVQPVGAVNEKVEGFFDACCVRGLTGAQGVLIPAANVKDLMLRRDVVQACAEGRFHVWAVRHVDEGIELLTGVPAGERRPDGSWPEGTVNARAAAQVAKLASEGRAFAAPDPKTGV